jgi:hypothetical protein
VLLRTRLDCLRVSLHADRSHAFAQAAETAGRDNLTLLESINKVRRTVLEQVRVLASVRGAGANATRAAVHQVCRGGQHARIRGALVRPVRDPIVSCSLALRSMQHRNRY